MPSAILDRPIRHRQDNSSQECSFIIRRPEDKIFLSWIKESYALHCCQAGIFTSESTNTKIDFTKEISSSYKVACLQCSFSDKELSEFIQLKKRKYQPIPVKYAVSHVGRHADGTSVIGNNAYFTNDGISITLEDSKYVWIGDIYQGRGVANDIDQCNISCPLSTDF